MDNTMLNSARIIHIMDKEYTIHCPEAQAAALREAAVLLDQKMRDIRQSGRVVGNERIAIMAALNIAHEAILARNPQGPTGEMASRIRVLHDKIDEVLCEALEKGPSHALETTD